MHKPTLPEPALRQRNSATWTKQHPAIAARACLTERARQWAFEQVGSRDAAVEWLARAFGVGWATIMRIVTARGKPVVDDPQRLDSVTAVGVDEIAFQRATGTHSTWYATGIADLSPDGPARLLDVVEGRSGTVLAAWLAQRDEQWTARIATASLDPFRSYVTALARQLPAAVRVLDPFHVVKLGLSAGDEMRRRVQHDQTGHRGRAGDPLYRIRRRLRRRADRLTERAGQRLRDGLVAGDSTGEVTAAWSIAQDLMACYHTRDRAAVARGSSPLPGTVRSPRSPGSAAPSPPGGPSSSPVSTIPRCPTDPPKPST
jgi:transposase